MAYKIKKKLKLIFAHRAAVVLAIFFLLSIILGVRIFQLQIVEGEEYANNFTITTTKTRRLASTRGNIYDCNGKLLAYNELSNSVTLEDIGSYETRRERNLSLNGEIYRLIKIIEGCGDTIDNDFHVLVNENGDYVYDMEEGTSLNRFRADIYGYQSISQLSESELAAQAADIMEELCGPDRFGIVNNDNPYTAEELAAHSLPAEMSREEILKIVAIRYKLSLTSYQKYLQVTVASDVSNATVAAIRENSSVLKGVDIEEDSRRIYNYPYATSSIIGYTGKPSSDELDSLLTQRSDYTSNSVIGKTGIEQYMETTLQGVDGSEEVAVDNLGTVLSVYEDTKIEPQKGNDVYLTIDADLQVACYDILEQRIAGILITNIRDGRTLEEITAGIVKEDPDDDDVIYIPSYDVYYALINNSVIDTDHFKSTNATVFEQAVYAQFLNYLSSVTADVKAELTGTARSALNVMSEEYQEYMRYIIDEMLIKHEVLTPQGNYENDDTYISWKNGDLSPYDYLIYAISKNWINLSSLYESNVYMSTTEILNSLADYVTDEIQTDSGFSKLIYKHMLFNDVMIPEDVIQLLYEQGVLSADDGEYSRFREGALSAYELIVSKISSLEITPAQLALDPCSGSAVITDPETGNVKALVTYPGYDNNRLANNMDVRYYKKLYSDLSTPFYNKATLQLTAPGSTFKPVMAAAALNEGVIDTVSTVHCSGLFGEGLVEPSNQLHCWAKKGHGDVNIVEAIQNSCNVFFCTMAYRLGLTEDGIFSYSKSLEKVREYASVFNLDTKTNIQINESNPNVTNSMPIPSSIGQGTHLYTTTQLARYAATLSNSGTSYDLNLLSKVTDSNGNLLQEFAPNVSKTVDFDDTIWDVIHEGMRRVVEINTTFENFPVYLSGKTGTAEESKLRPNHALFIGYSNYETNDDIAFAIRIAYGYSSTNACTVAKDILTYYYGLSDSSQIITGTSATEGLSSTVTD